MPGIDQSRAILPPQHRRPDRLRHAQQVHEDRSGARSSSGSGRRGTDCGEGIVTDERRRSGPPAVDRRSRHRRRHHDRRHRLHRARRDARGAGAALREKDGRLRRDSSRWLSYQKVGTSTIQSRATGGVAGGDLSFRPPRLARRLPRRLGGNFGPPARQPPPPLQPRRAHAAPPGAFAQGEKLRTTSRELLSQPPARRSRRTHLPARHHGRAA